jgi:perosamine synthetase
MMKTIPPVGTPISWGVIFSRGNKFALPFDKELFKLFNSRVYLTNSGKSALYLILKAAKNINPEKTEVIVPNYSCWSLPSAIVKSGLKVALADNDLNTFGILNSSVINAISTRTLAVICPHLFGIPGKISELQTICRDKGVFLIDDAAQALGASLDDRPVGSFGDAGILSFGRGKNITTNSGGAALIGNEELKAVADDIYKSEFTRMGQSKSKDIVQMTAYKLLFPRCLYWIPDSIPQLNIGSTFYNPEFSLQGFSEYRKGLGSSLLKNLKTINDNRNKIASRYQELLQEVKAVKIPGWSDRAKPAFLRYPILLKNPDNKRLILNNGHNLGISGMYPDTISNIPALKNILIEDSSNCPNSEQISKRLVTLPTHHSVKEKDILKIVGLITKICC